MPQLNDLVNAVRNYLSLHHMFADNDWLSGCVEYLTENGESNYNEADIKNLAREQWLLNDLKDICPGSLPANLKTQKTVLSGKYVLQINAAEDIGTPAYQQYLKLQKVNIENIEATTNFEEKISNHRMIKLYLTDGVQDISAIEYKPMRNLSCDITPGSKVLVKGPLECRRGVLLLTENSIELLGGEVQEIAVSNSLVGRLSSKLGLPMNQETNLNTTITQIRNTNIPTPHTQMPAATFEQNEPLYDQTKPIARVTSLQVANNAFNDDDIDFDELAAIEAEFSDNSGSGKRSLVNTISNPEKKLKMDNNRSDEFPDENDIFMEEDDDYLREIEAKFDAKENELNRKANKDNIPISSDPFVYIKQINDLSDADKFDRIFRVKGQILKLLSKLSVGKDGWSLRCTIIDGTGCIDVDFTSDVLSKLVGYSPQEMNQLKKDMATKPELKEKAVLALQKARDSLQVLYCIIELTIKETPKITKLIPFNDTHVDLLKIRNANV